MAYGIYQHERRKLKRTGSEIMNCVIICVFKGIFCNNFTEEKWGGGPFITEKSFITNNMVYFYFSLNYYVSAAIMPL